LVRDLNATRRLADDSRIQWTPNTLSLILQNELPDAEVLVVSNREPYSHVYGADESVVLQTPASGLVSALEPVTIACGGTWIAHGSGNADRETVDADDRLRVPPDGPAYTLRRVWLTEEEEDGYYYGFSNEGLWPLCHLVYVRPIFRTSDWTHYVGVNRKFADAIAREARTSHPIVLIQDYHFALLPKMVKEQLPDATIITFWHIPWPNAETFGICPWRSDVLEGLLGSSIVGFHTQFHCNNFIETVDRFLESRIDREHSSISFGGRETLVRPYPISIHWPAKALERQNPVEDCRRTVRERFALPPDVRLAVGIERFDYTKGIVDRMQAVEALLTLFPEWRGRFAYLQVAAPSRTKLAAYRDLQDEAVALAQEINGRHQGDGIAPILLSVRHHGAAEVFEICRAADVCIVSSLHDGMNLVAKEFVAARDDEQGTLVLSSFAGASRELIEALIVNPYDTEGMARTIHQALIMAPEEQRERMRLMRDMVNENNVYRWAGRMLIDAARVRRHHRIADLIAASRNGHGEEPGQSSCSSIAFR
jgi:trehalose 6-phosphate synthase